MKPLTLEETRLKEEMKSRCLAKGQYKDEKAKDKFKMLCHLEDFEVQYWELQKENQQLKSILVELEETIKNKIKGFKEDKDYFIDEKDMYELDNLIQKLKEKYKC